MNQNLLIALTFLGLVVVGLFSCNQVIVDKSIGLFPVKEYGMFGFINSKGENIIKCQFDEARKFCEGLAPIRKDSLWGFIDTTGKIVIEPKYFRVWQFSNGLCRVRFQEDTSMVNAFINKDGSIAFISKYDDAEFFFNARAEVKINEEVCFINKRGEVVINTHFPYGAHFYEGIAKLWTGDSCKYIDTTGKVIARFPSMGNNDFHEGKAYVYVEKKHFYINKLGKPIIIVADSEIVCFDFSDGMAEIVIPGGNHKSGFIDTTGNIVIPIKYPEANKFKEGLAGFREEDKWGFINKKGEVVIKPQYDEIEYDGFNNGLCWAIQNHHGGYINHKGKFVWKEQVDIQYGKIDLAKWNLDTLECTVPLACDKYIGGGNHSGNLLFKTLSDLTLKVDTSDITVFADRYFGYKLTLINASKDTVLISQQDGTIEIIEQAVNAKGEWQDIENYYNSWCGNSYHIFKMFPHDYQTFPIPIFKGKIKTKLRFKLEHNKRNIYSNTFVGKINIGQFLEDIDKDNTGIAVTASGFAR